jgi:hypothetical protein
MGMADHYELATKLRRMAGAHAHAQAGDPEWGVVMLFYSALHVTSAYLINAGQGAQTSHQGMTAAINACPALDPRFRSAYKALSTFSWNARYNPGYTMSPANHYVANDRFRIVKWFTEADVRAALGLPAGSDL